MEIVGIKATQNTVVTGVEMFRKLLDEGQPAITSDTAPWNRKSPS